MNLLDVVGNGAIDPLKDGNIGRRWADSVCQVAWRLFVTANAQMK